MQEKIYETKLGNIHYWTNTIDAKQITLVFLPGLTADHRLFEKQLAYFENKYNVFVWDAPGHSSSWPFEFSFSLMDKARWLHEILEKENITKPVIIGQSMGGYVAQAFSELYPQKLKGFVAIDSAPLQKTYVTGLEIWLLKRMEPVYLYYPWKYLLKHGTNGVAVSDYGRKLMLEIMMEYDGEKKRYAKLAGHGFKILAEAMEENLAYEIKCPALLICGEKDRAGSCLRYNRAWHKKTGIPIEWIKGAGHNSNTDEPEIVNALLEKFVLEKSCVEKSMEIFMKKRVYEFVKTIPEGKVVTYGQIAEYLGNKYWARTIGNMLHQNPDPANIPCHRVVNSEGKVADKYAFGGAEMQRKKLEQEGIVFEANGKIDLKKYGMKIE